MWSKEFKHPSSPRMTQFENKCNVGIKEQRWANCCFAHHFKKGDKRNLFGNKAFDSFSRSELLKSMLMKILVFWDTTPCMTESYLREFERSAETFLDRSNQSSLQCFAWRQALQRSLLFQFAVSRGQLFLVYIITINIQFLLTILQEYAGNIFVGHTNVRHVWHTRCSLHIDIL